MKCACGNEPSAEQAIIIADITAEAIKAFGPQAVKMSLLEWHCITCCTKRQDEADAAVRAAMSKRDYRHLS